MFNRAKELADDKKPGHCAIAMLNTIVKVYKETPTANEAKAALARSEKNLPLFRHHPDRHCRKPRSLALPPSFLPPPKAVVNATPEASGQCRRRAGRAGAACYNPIRGGCGATISQDRRRTKPEPRRHCRSAPASRGFKPIFKRESTRRAFGCWSSSEVIVMVPSMMLVPGGTFTMGLQ